VLSGYRVLDLSDERGQLAGRMLADLGADVIKIEPPGGDPQRGRGPARPGRAQPDGLAWLAWNAGKRSLVLDLAGSREDRERFLELVARADVVLDSFSPGTLEAWGLGEATLLESLPSHHPGLVYCSITPFGRTGPRSHFAGHDLVAVAMGGNAAMTGEAVIGIALALYGREELGAGQTVDVSLQECQLATLITGAGQYALSGRAGRRAGGRTGRTREIWRCADGWVSYGLRGGPARIGNLIATVEYMAESDGAPDWLREMDWSTYDPMSLDDAELARLEGAFAAFFARKSMRELYEQALERRILLAPCNDAREILAQPQLRSRDFFAEVEAPGFDRPLETPGFFARSNRTIIGLRGPAPALDQDADVIRCELEGPPRDFVRLPPAHESGLDTGCTEAGVLSGLRVLEFGSGAAGPVATRYLAEQGATVIRIESSKRPDFLRLLHVTARNRNEPDVLERAPMFVLLNPNKESLSVDMKSAEGAALVRRLVDWADVVAENFAPGVMAKWGFDYERLAAEKPELVMLSGCLFGQTGPQRGYPGFGGQGSAIAGFNHMTGWGDGEALGPYATITDSLAPRFVAAALVCALIERRRSGRGQYIDVSQIEAGAYCLSEMLLRGTTMATRRLMASTPVAPRGAIQRKRVGSRSRSGTRPSGGRWSTPWGSPMGVRDPSSRPGRSGCGNATPSIE